MIFRETPVDGVFIVEPEKIPDERGFFACSWLADEFAERGLNQQLVQCNVAFNKTRGTLRGMHFQIKPYEQTKLVRCTRGAVYEVALDLRSDSPTRYRWAAAELTSDNHRMLYIPEGFAHGYQTLTDDAEIFYQISEYYHAESESGVRWDDPAFAIDWPLPVTVIAKRDATYPFIDLTTPA